MARTLFVVSYDVTENKRRNRIRRFLLGYRVAGQKSCFECWVTPRDVRQVLVGLSGLIVPGEDRVHLFQLDERMAVRCFGSGETFKNYGFFIL